MLTFQVEKRPQETPRKVGVTMQPRPQRQGQGGKKLFCCCGRRPISPEDEDRIAHYFRKMDPHNTGFVTWKQFKKVHKEEYNTHTKKIILTLSRVHIS